MCGIIGLAGAIPDELRVRLTRARESMLHRGPDDAGEWSTERCVLAARRLSIQDRSPAGHQPLVSDDGRTAVVLNGEIYNFHRLREQLAATHRFHGGSDTEVLLHGYHAWGIAGLLQRIDGMFAFAIWDGETETLHIARDRIGEKPLFVEHRGTGIAFASTLVALVTLRGQTPRVDPAALDAFLIHQAVPAPMTMFTDVRQLPPAHAIRFDARSGRLTEYRYWDVSFAHKVRMDAAEVTGETERILRQAMRERMVAEVPLGVFLSGGVDSSLIAAFASQKSSTPVVAMTVGFEDDQIDERPFARQVASHLKLDYHEALLRPALVADLPEIVWHFGQPVADVSIVPHFYLAREARQRMTVALNGYGGDELFGGYARPVLLAATAPYREIVPAEMRHWLATRLPSRSRVRVLNRLQQFAEAGDRSPAENFIYDRAFRRFREAAYSATLWGQVGARDPDALYQQVWAHAQGDDVDRAIYGDLTTYLPDQLLPNADATSMAHSLEVRAPLLARAMVEFAATIPSQTLLRHYQQKYVLKSIASHLVPESVLYRRKQGFVMPAGRWLRRELAPYLRAALDSSAFLDHGWVDPGFVRRILAEHESGARDWAEQLWTLLVLAIWARLSLDASLDRRDTLDVIVGDRRRSVRALGIGLEWQGERSGGLNRVFRELSTALPDVGVDQYGLVVGSSQVSAASGGRVEAVAPVDATVWQRAVSVRRRAVQFLRDDPDRVIAAHFALYAAPLVGWLHRRPFVFHFHGPWGDEVRAEGRRGLTPRAIAALERFVYRRADALIVLSEAFAMILVERFGIPRSRIHVIPPGVDLRRFALPITRGGARERLGWPADRRIVLAVRRLVRRVGLEDLIAAAPAIRDAAPSALIVIAGTGPLRASLVQQITALGVQDHVRLVGFLPESALPYAYRAAELTVVPTVALEGFGLIVAESLAAGTPPLVTPVGGLPEAVRGLSPDLVLRATGPAAIAEGVIGALNGTRAVPDEEACRAFARTTYDWRLAAARTRDVYLAAQRA
ncbi:MAG: asparagine synthase (glutamine-hydrolyzing) [Gemmatimonadaceae bacterium]|nr:asparagine synthase (glutamine-hydrolyzing) [Gemmatimonadaceae bacterium]